MPILALLTVAIALYSLMLIFLSRASGKIDPYWSSTIFGVISVLTPLSLWLFGRARHQVSLPATSAGIGYSVAAGAIAGIFTALLVRIFAQGAVSFATPTIYCGVMVVTSLIGWLVFKETITAMQAAGIVLSALGVSLIVYSKFSGIAA